MRHFLSAIVVLAFLAAFGTAHAATSDAGAAEIKKMLDDALAFQLDMAKSTGEGLTMGGEIKVVPKDDFYEAALPDLTMVYPNGKLAIGTVIVNISEARNGEYSISTAIPSTMKFYDTQNAPVSEISIGKQRLSLVWRPVIK